MRLTSLEPVFVRFETRVETYQTVNGEVTGPREYSIRVPTLTEAQGIRFLCPACCAKKGGAVGTHGIEVTFHDRGVLPNQGSHNDAGAPSRWHVSGDTFENLTLTPSIDVGCWHGFITNSDAR